jgi:hypothetical protein
VPGFSVPARMPARSRSSIWAPSVLAGSRETDSRRSNGRLVKDLGAELALVF